MKNDFKQLTMLFCILIPGMVGLYLYYARKSFQGSCHTTDYTAYPCSYGEFIGSGPLSIALLLIGIYLFMLLLIFIIRKLNYYGFNIESTSWKRLLVVPMLYELYKALRNWANDTSPKK